jgi:hypothetical protein
MGLQDPWHFPPAAVAGIGCRLLPTEAECELEQAKSDHEMAEKHGQVIGKLLALWECPIRGRQKPALVGALKYC